MVVTVRDVLDDELFTAADLRVEVPGSGLDRPVRWVFANEREDVASFLSGGELLIVEVASLIADAREKRLDEYVRSLVDADVSALMVELVEGAHELPDGLVQSAEAEGLTVIGLHRRIPFVDICQKVNTVIVRGRMRTQMRVDVMSTSLRSELAMAGNVQAVADTLHRVFEEGVAIFDMDGLEVARAGRIDNVAADCIVLPLADQSRPLGALEISQRNVEFDDSMKRRIRQIVSPVLAVYLDGGARVGIIAHLIAGPEDGVHVTSMEARDGHAMLDALGFAASSIYMPFTMMLRSVSAAVPAVSTMIESFESRDGYEVVSLLEGDMVTGFFAARDSEGKVSVFADCCMDALHKAIDDGYAYAVHGRVALDTISLMDAFGALCDIRNGWKDKKDDDKSYGGLACIDSVLFDKMFDVEHTDDAIHMVITQTVGYELLHEPVLIDTLCACFDNLDNKTGACEQLGIQRQTLYNRLDKVTQIVGISPSDKISWSMLLFGAKLAQTQRKRAVFTSTMLR